MIDKIISDNISIIQNGGLTKLMLIITNIGNKYFILFFSLILAALLLFHKKDYMKVKIFIISIFLGAFFSQALKYLIKRIRPENMLIEQGGYSFPSGHATLSMIFFGMLIYLFKDEIKNNLEKYIFIALNILLILLIGISRIYLNVHYLTDVLGGYILGYICIILSIYIYKKYLKNFDLKHIKN